MVFGNEQPCLSLVPLVHVFLPSVVLQCFVRFILVCCLSGFSRSLVVLAKVWGIFMM